VASFEQAQAALRRGDTLAARRAFEALLSAGDRRFEVHLGLAYACAAAADAGAGLAAVDAALTLDPRELRALLLKADLLRHRGDPLAAGFYAAALKVAGSLDAVPPALAPHLARAEQALAATQVALERQLVNDLEAAGAGETTWSPRFRQSIDLLSGRRQLYPSSPTMYHFPELPTVQFFDRERFEWLPALEAATPAIRAELMALLPDRRERFAPYIQSDPTRPRLNTTALLDNDDWGACFLWKDGRLVEENACRCPLTVQALSQVPLVQVPGRSPNVLFSRLAPGAHIEPHHGFVNTRLIGHLPLIVPGDCSFRVGNEVREWSQGRAWLFDDTIEHEAWNRSGHERVVLIFEVWRPELSEAERAQVKALFEAIGRRPGGIPGWGI
jgi:aspartyl/asparaginyl beta-hydroxylase (cupin superfamily)